MKGGNILLVLLGAGALYFFTRKGVQAIAKKRTAMARFQIKKVSMNGLNILVRIGVLNPSNSALKLSAFVGGLKVGKSEVAKVKNFKPVDIKAAGESDIDLTLVPSGLGVLTLLKTIFAKKVGKMGAVLVGTANVNGMVLPINMKF